MKEERKRRGGKRRKEAVKKERKRKGTGFIDYRAALKSRSGGVRSRLGVTHSSKKVTCLLAFDECPLKMDLHY